MQAIEVASLPPDPVAAAMMNILKARGLNESLTHFRFEGEFCLSCDWRRINLKMSTEVCFLLYRSIWPRYLGMDSISSCKSYVLN